MISFKLSAFLKSLTATMLQPIFSLNLMAMLKLVLPSYQKILEVHLQTISPPPPLSPSLPPSQLTCTVILHSRMIFITSSFVFMFILPYIHLLLFLSPANVAALIASVTTVLCLVMAMSLITLIVCICNKGKIKRCYQKWTHSSSQRWV